MDDDTKKYLAEVMAFDGLDIKEAEIYERKDIMVAWAGDYIYYINLLDSDEIVRISKQPHPDPLVYSRKLGFLYRDDQKSDKFYYRKYHKGD